MRERLGINLGPIKDMQTTDVRQTWDELLRADYRHETDMGKATLGPINAVQIIDI